MADDWLGNLFEGLKQGYMDGGGATPANVFSGPTPLAGDAPAGFAGGLGDFIGGLGGRVSDLALHTLPEFVKDPSSFFNDRGELSMTRVISPDFRRNAVKERKQEEQAQNAMLVARGLNQFNDFTKSLGDAPESQRAAMATQAESMGMPSGQIDAALGQANQQDQGRQQAVGMLAPDVGGQGMAEGLLSSDPNIAAAAKLSLSQRIAQRRQEAINARAAARDARAAAAFAARDLRSPEDKQAARQAEREAARQAQVAKEKATAEATAAAGDVNEKYKPLLKTAVDVPQATIDASRQDWNPFNNYPEGTKSRENLIAQRAAERRAARAEAYKAIDQAVPPNSRKNIGLRKKLRAAVPATVQTSQDVGLGNPIISDPPPADPAERITAARTLGEQLLAAGFPPEKAVAELLRRGYTHAEIPE